MSVEHDEARLLELLEDSLALWRVTGTVATLYAPAVALVERDDGLSVTVERVSDDSPFRWIVRDSSGHGRRCASLVGLLGALRSALGAGEGVTVRVA